MSAYQASYLCCTTIAAFLRPRSPGDTISDLDSVALADEDVKGDDKGNDKGDDKGDDKLDNAFACSVILNKR